jgi:predicted TIM-barrel fold metal-dependent hydrolase
LLSIIAFKLNDVNRKNLIPIGILFGGIVITILGVVLSPAFIEHNFSAIKFVEDENLEILANLQLLTILIGGAISFLGLIIYLYKNTLKLKKIRVIIFIIAGIIYFTIIYNTYLSFNYPNNIISKPHEYYKIVELLLGHDILLSDFDPAPTLKVERKNVVKAKFPVIDVNFHMNSQFQTKKDRQLLSVNNLLKSMDSVGVKFLVNLDGPGNHERPNEFFDDYQSQHPNRFSNFRPIWFPPNIIYNSDINRLVRLIDKLVKENKTQGIKIWKYIGLRTRDSLGQVIPVDSPKLQPIWDKVREFNIPVVWHMGDPASMFLKIDKYNERFEELGDYSEWSFYGERFPERVTILKGRENVLKQNPDIIFIGAHMGMNAEDLNYISYLLDNYSNYYVELSTVLSELGRQPYTTRKFFIKYQDRILFGTDGGSLFGADGWSVEKFYQAYFEFLETDNEYIEYPMQGAINQGGWRIYGINLPDSVLEKIYYKNASKLLNINLDF